MSWSSSSNVMQGVGPQFVCDLLIPRASSRRRSSLAFSNVTGSFISEGIAMTAEAMPKAWKKLTMIVSKSKALMGMKLSVRHFAFD